MLRFSGASYRPKTEIEKFQSKNPEQLTESAKEALRILGRRINALCYFNHEVKIGRSNFARIMADTNELNIELAKIISENVSDVPYHDTMRPVMLHDVASTQAIPEATFAMNEEGNFVIDKATLPYKLLQDNSFLVVVLNRERYIEIFIYEKVSIAA